MQQRLFVKVPNIHVSHSGAQGWRTHGDREVAVRSRITGRQDLRHDQILLLVSMPPVPFSDDE